MNGSIVGADLHQSSIKPIEPKTTDMLEEKFLPIDYVLSGKHVFVHYIAGPTKKPTDSFIAHTEQRQKEVHASRKLVPLMETDIAEKIDLAGMVFHTARCGSTLLCNMLDTLPNCYVVRESGVVNKILNDPELNHDRKKYLLYTVLNDYICFAQYLGAQCIIKFSSYCTLHLPYLLSLLPEIPWIYLYREPEAVVNSLIRHRADWVSSEFIRRVLGIADTQIPEFPAQQAALVLHRCFKQVVDCYSEQHHNGRLMSYRLLIDGTKAAEIAHHFGFEISTEVFSRMNACLQFDAKTGVPRLGSSGGKCGIQLTVKPEYTVQVAEAKREANMACAKFCWRDYEILCSIN